MRKPTTTHFAVLGLLAVRPWTTYELIQYMKRSNLRNLWTKTEGRLYETPAELVELGFASARRERISSDPDAAGRERTRYTITRSGRAALRKWLAKPPQPARFEIEGLLKLAYGEQATVQQFISQIEAIQQQMAATAGFQNLLDAAAEPQLPSRHHLSARIADLGDRVGWLVLGVAGRAEGGGRRVGGHEDLARTLGGGAADLRRHPRASDAAGRSGHIHQRAHVSRQR